LPRAEFRRRSPRRCAFPSADPAAIRTSPERPRRRCGPRPRPARCAERKRRRRGAPRRPPGRAWRSSTTRPEMRAGGRLELEEDVAVAAAETGIARFPGEKAAQVELAERDVA